MTILLLEPNHHGVRKFKELMKTYKIGQLRILSHGPGKATANNQ